MATTNYYSVEGGLLGQKGVGSRLDVGLDALGSVVSTIDNSGQIDNMYRYKPFGDQLVKTGSGVDPSFKWNGSTGYFHQSVGPYYVRARHYDASTSAWTTVDRYWPEEPAYVYCGSNPTTLVDSDGLRPSVDSNSCSGCTRLGAPVQQKYDRIINLFCDKLGRTGSKERACIKACAVAHGDVVFSCLEKHFCGSSIVISCSAAGLCDNVAKRPPRCPPGCREPRAPRFPAGCMVTQCNTTSRKLGWMQICCHANNDFLFYICGCPCIVPHRQPGLNCENIHTLFHELAHFCGTKGSDCNGDTDDPVMQRKNNLFGWCISKCLGFP
jgi:RHS repeat-associated protein